MINQAVTRTIIPAEPGWQLARVGDGGKPLFFTYHPIVAWDVRCTESRRIATPITPTDSLDGDLGAFGADWALKSPDGKYHVTDNVFAREADALAFISTVHDVMEAQCT